MRSTPDRGVVTDYLLTQLAGQGWPVGDVVAPEGAGWQNDMTAPNSVFVPYLVLTPLNANGGTGTLGDSSTEWRLPYSLSTYGVSRRQVEDLADDARRFIAGFKKITLTMKDGTTTWKIQQSTWQAMGGIGYTNQVTPTALSQTDSLLIWLSKNS